MTQETWPDSNVPYIYPDRSDENAQRWRTAIDAARQNGTLRLIPGDRSNYNQDLTGQCPRCGHDMDQPIEFDVIMPIRGLPPMFGRFNVQCNCRKAHADRDSTHQGCGWGGWIPVDIDIDRPSGGQDVAGGRRILGEEAD